MTVPKSPSPLGLLVLIQIFALVWPLPGPVLGKDRPLPIAYEKEIRFATLQDLYPSVNDHEARLALELIMQKTLLQKSYAYKVLLDFIDRTIDAETRIQNGSYDFVTLSGLDYFRFKDSLQLKPLLIPSKTDRPTETLVLITNKDQSLAAIALKKERTLLIESGSNGELSKRWVDTLLTAKGFPASETFFTTIRRVKKPGRAVIPVFFGQADACIVTLNAFDTISVLNPQIDKQLTSRLRSEGLVRMLICATPKANGEDIKDFIRESINIEHNPDTQQAMTIIQMKRFILVTPNLLDATEKLIQKHN